MVSMVAVAMPCVSIMSGVPAVCFVTSVVLAFVSMAFMTMPVVITVVTVMIVASTVLVVTSIVIVRIVAGRLMRSCWGLTHSCFLLVCW